MSNWRVSSTVLVVLYLCAVQASPWSRFAVSDNSPQGRIAQRLYNQRSLNDCESCSIEGDWFSVEYMTTNCTDHDNCILNQKYFRKVNFGVSGLSETSTVEQIITMSNENGIGALISVQSNIAECVIYNYADLTFDNCVMYNKFERDNCYVYDNKDEFDNDYFSCTSGANCNDYTMDTTVVFSADCNTLTFKPNGNLDSNIVYLIRDSSASSLFTSTLAMMSALVLLLM